MNARFFILPLSLLALGACAPGIAGVGAAVGVAAAQEGGLSRAYSDAKIQTRINDLWFSYDVDMFRKLDMTVNQGRVLITGVVQNPEHRVEAVRLAWQPEGVQQVINEIRVADSDGITGFARDTWISTRLRTAITLDRNIQSINYTIDTVQGTVYLMGVARNQAELNRVISKARTIPDVRQVVSYVKLSGEPLESEKSSAATSHNNVYEETSYDQEYYVSDDYEAGGSQSYTVEPVQSEELLDAQPQGWSDY